MMTKVDVVRKAMMDALKAGDKPRKEALSLLVIEETLAELGLSEPTAKDKGRLMKALMPKVRDKADGAAVNRLVGTYLK